MSNEKTKEALQEAISGLGHTTVDVDALARRFGVTAQEVMECMTAVEDAERASIDTSRVSRADEEAAARTGAVSALAMDPNEPLLVVDSQGVLDREESAPAEPPDGYELIGEIGRGGMGVVYRARQVSLDREVAVKVLLPGHGEDTLRRFQLEVRSLARLRHPHIVQVHEVGETAGSLYYSMELIVGRPLDDLLGDGPLLPTQAVRLFRQVTDAIAYSHERGIIHRDLKPSNILVNEDGEAFVVDFGLARDLASRTDLTRTGQILGTPAYMSPEQARGQNELIGEASDIYALGAILYECLTGRAPFAGNTLVDLINDVVTRDPAPVRRVASNVPDDLGVIVEKAMRKSPRKRYHTARALLEDLERFEEGRPILARRPGPAQRAWRWVARHRAGVATVGVTLAVAVGLFWGLVLPWLAPRTSLESAQHLADQGYDKAAALLYEEGLDKQRSVARAVLRARRRSVDPMTRDLRLGALRSLGRAADERFVAGDYTESAVLHQRARTHASWLLTRGGPPRVLADLAWQSLLCQAMLGDRSGVLAELERLSETLAAASPAETAFDPVLERVFDVLGRADHAELEPVARLVALGHAESVWSAELDPYMARISGAAGELARRLVPLLGPALGRRDLYRFLRRLVSVSAGGPDVWPLVAVFRDLVKEEELPACARALALELLCEGADLPVWSDVEMPTTVDVRRRDEALALELRLRGESRLQRYRACVGHVLTSHGRDLGRYAEWLADRTGRRPEASGDALAAAWRDWWRAHGESDPRGWLSEALGLGAQSGRTRPESLLERFLREPESQHRIWMHHLLRLAAPPSWRRPFWRSGIRRPGTALEPERLAARWYAAPGDAARRDPHVLKLAVLRFIDGRPRPSTWFERETPIRIGETVTLAKTFDVPHPGKGEVQFSPPGLHVIDIATQGRRFECAVRLDWSTDGLFVGLDRLDWGQPGTEPWARSFRARVGMVLARPFDIEHTDGEWNAHGCLSETYLLLLTVERARTAQHLGWPARITTALRQLGELAARVPPVVSRDGVGWPALQSLLHYGESLWHLPRVGAWLPLPEARGPLSRLQAALDALHSGRWSRRFQGDRRYGPAADQLMAARLLAGDEAMAAPAASAGLARALRGMGSAGRTFWGRLALLAEEPLVRERAFEALEAEGVRGPTALAIEQSVGERSATVPGWLEEAVSGTRRRLVWSVEGWSLLWVGLLFFAGLALLAFTVWSGPGPTRLRAASWLIVVGVATLASRWDVPRWDATPMALGLGLMLIGVAALTRVAAGRFRFICTAALAGALPLELAFRFGLIKGQTEQLAYLALVTALLALPALLAGLRPVGKRSRRRYRALLAGFYALYGVPMLVLHASGGDIGEWVGPRAARALDVVLGAGLACLVGVLGVLVYAAHRRAGNDPPTLWRRVWARLRLLAPA